ncbi:ArnT family glycosyltransferase [Pseudodesulfovibrio mercurii]|uniref:ArnT family glycosyltransferase n=1 Tax=Pseudodesulfovibrio mercurii TaxID=641491 RepID=UPI0011D2C70F|nr:hypothetical protein [Pseudodesulfovibrio mercurii]
MKEDARGRRYALYGCLLFLVALSLLFRFLTSELVEDGGDAVYKWMLVKQYVLFGDLPASWNHHACRWAVNIPVFFIQKWFGTAPTVYYVWPFFLSTLTVVFGFLLLARLRSWRVGLVGGILIVLSLPMIRLGSQILPMGAVITYLLGALYCLTRWRDDGGMANMIASALFFSLAYGAKVTSIYYLPAFLLLIWMLADGMGARVRYVLCFLGVFLVVYAAETAVFDLLTGASLGRLELIQHSHRPIRTIDAAVRNWQSYSVSLTEYLANFLVYFRHPGGFVSILLYGTFLVSVSALLRKWRNIYIPAVPFLFGFLGHAYAITSVFPFNRPERMLFRYQFVEFELAILIMMLFLSTVRFEGLARKCRLPVRLGERGIRAVLFAALVLLIARYAVPAVHADTGCMRTARVMETVRQARAEGLPVFIPEGEDEKHTVKGIHKYRALYTEIRYHGNVPYYDRSHGLSLEDFPALTRDGKTYLLMERNGFAGEWDDRAVILTEY